MIYRKKTYKTNKKQNKKEKEKYAKTRKEVCPPPHLIIMDKVVLLGVI